MRISDRENTELNELDEQLKGAYKHIDDIQNRIDDIFNDHNSTSEGVTEIDR